MKTMLIIITVCIATFALTTRSFSLEPYYDVDPINCLGCGPDVTYRFRVCIGNVMDSIDVTMCTQYAGSQFIQSPCPSDTLPLNAVSFIRNICVPPSLATVSIDTIYRAVIKATSLCCFHPFLPVIVPPCINQGPKDSCVSSISAYCHALAMPRCMHLVTNCWQPCGQPCAALCYLTRRYCTITDSNGVFCKDCTRSYCQSGNVQCQQPCQEIQCSILQEPIGCCSFSGD